MTTAQPSTTSTDTSTILTTADPSVSTSDSATFTPLQSCTIVYDDMDGAQKNVHLWSTEWTFSNESIYESFGWSDCNSDMCIRLSGHYPAMTRTFSNIKSYDLTNVQIKYYIYAIRGYLIQYKWTDNEWTDLWYGDYITGPINYIHNLPDPPLGDVSLSIRFRWFPYCDRQDLGYCDWSPVLYVDNFYLTADMVSCPTEKPTTTTIPPCVIVYDNMDDATSTGWFFGETGPGLMHVETYEYGKLNGRCLSDACVLISGNYPVIGRRFDNFKSYSDQMVVNVQVKYHVYSRQGYLIQYKWSVDMTDWTNDWIDLFYYGYNAGPTNYTHDLTDPPFGNVSLFIRFSWLPYCDVYCDSSPDIYIDNFYLTAEMSSCPTDKPTTTILTVTTQNSTLLETEETVSDPVLSGESKVVFSSEMVNVIIFIVGGLICVIVVCCIVRACNNHLKSKKKTKYAVEEAWNNRQCKQSDQFTIEIEMEGNVLNNKTGANHLIDNDDKKCDDCDGLEQERNELKQESQDLLNDQNETENINNQIIERNKLLKSEDAQLTEQLDQSKKLVVAADSDLALLKQHIRELNGKVEQIEESNKCEVDGLMKQNVALNQQKNEMKQSNDNMQSEIVSLKKKLNSFEIEQKELLTENQQLEQEIKQFMMQTEKYINIDVTKYLEWDSNEIVNWIVSLDSGRYWKYKDMLQESLRNEGVTGKHLCQVNEADIKGWGVVQFDDKKDLSMQIKQLINVQNK